MSYGAHRNNRYARSQNKLDPYDPNLNPIYHWEWGDEDRYNMARWAEDDRWWGRLNNMSEYHQFKLLNLLVKLLIWPAKRAIEERYW